MSEQWALITGHLDDSASQTCRSPQLTDAEAIDVCRQAFVVTALQPITPPTPGPAQ